jgi:hypothetical protein
VSLTAILVQARRHSSIRLKEFFKKNQVPHADIKSVEASTVVQQYHLGATTHSLFRGINKIQRPATIRFVKPGKNC